MTLEQAYQQLKKEARSLRRENEKLKSGSFFDEERASYEKQIRILSREKADFQKKSEEYYARWCDSRFRPEHHLDDLSRICELEEELSRLSLLNDSLSQQLQTANDTIAKLKAQLNRDHENSSLPSSARPFHKKIKNSRVSSGKKSGGQKGHPGHKRPHMEPTIPVIELVPDYSILNNPDYYPTGEYIRKQIADLYISVSVAEYCAQIYRNRITGARYHAPFPKGAVNEFNYGGNVKALTFLLNNYCNVSIDKTKELIEEISDGRILLSKGMINGLSKKFSDATLKDRKHIYSMLLEAPFMNTDFTSGRVNGKNVQVNICTNPQETLYTFSRHKGHEGIAGTPVEEYLQTLVHDHDLTFYKYGTDHQECLAHILRYLQDGADNEPDLSWHSQMKSFLAGIIHEAKKDRHFSQDRIRQIEEEYDSIVNTAYEEYVVHPPNSYYPDGYNLFKRMITYKKNHLLFLYHPEIDYTNNRAERGLRKFKRKFKQAVTFRCEHSVEELCNCMSVLETHHQQGANLFQITKEVFS